MSRRDKPLALAADTLFAHLKRIVPPDVTCDVPLSSRSFHMPIRKKGLVFWYCYRNAKSEVIQSFDYFLAQPQARQAYPSAFQEAQRTSKRTVTHSSPGEWQMKLSCTSHQAHLHRAADRKKTWFPPLPDSRRDSKGSPQAGKNAANRVPNKYNKDTPIVILNAVKDLLPFPHKLPWPFSRAFAHSWENCRCMLFRHRGGKTYSRRRFIVRTASLH